MKERKRKLPKKLLKQLEKLRELTIKVLKECKDSPLF